MHVKDLTARFERPILVETTLPPDAVPVPQLSGSSVSELRQRFEQAVIDEQKEVINDEPMPKQRADTLQLPTQTPSAGNEARGLSAPAITTFTRFPSALLPANGKSSAPSIGNAPFEEDEGRDSAPIERPSQSIDAQPALPFCNTTEQNTDQITNDLQQSAPKQPQRLPSEFTEASCTHSQSMISGSTISPTSDFVPQTIDDVGIIPDVSEGELDDIDGIERVDDYDSQEDSQLSYSSSDDQNDTFQRAETLSDPQVSYRTEGGESLHIVEGSYSQQEGDSTNDDCSDYNSDQSEEEQERVVFSELANTLRTQSQSHQTYSGYSYSHETAPLSSFHESPIPSQALFSRAITCSTSEGFKSANNDFVSASDCGPPGAPLDSTPRKSLQEEANTPYNSTVPFPSAPTVPHASSPPTSVRALENTALFMKQDHSLDEAASEEELELKVYSQNRVCVHGSIKRLPKAKVLIARRRGQSVNLDTSTSRGDTGRPERNAAVSADEIGRRRLVRDISNPGDFFAGQVSMVQRTSENDLRESEVQAEEYDSPPSPRRKPLGELRTFHRQQQRHDAFRKRYDEFIDAEGLNRTPNSEESSVSESDLLEEKGSSKMKYRPRMKLFGRKNAAVGKLEKDRLRAKRHEKRKEDIARRSTILSGALDRVSMAADPWIDFITDAKAMPVPEKSRGSLRRAVKRLFGGKGKQGLIKE